MKIKKHMNQPLRNSRYSNKLEYKNENSSNKNKQKILTKYTIKISYSCMDNMEKIITKQKKKINKSNNNYNNKNNMQQNNTIKCNCRNKKLPT